MVAGSGWDRFLSCRAGGGGGLCWPDPGRTTLQPILLSYLPAFSLVAVVTPSPPDSEMTVLEQDKTGPTMSDRYITPEYLAHLPTSVSTTPPTPPSSFTLLWNL